MANYEYVFAYSSEYEAQLRRDGLPCPLVRTGNRGPYLGDVIWAAVSFPDLALDPARQSATAVALFDSSQPLSALSVFANTLGDKADEQGLAMRGSTLWELRLTAKLSEKCGQLVWLPASGDPSIILDATSNPEAILELLKMAEGRNDAWEYVYSQLYSSQSTTSD